MNDYMNEEVAWQRLQDIEREVENRRLMADGGAPEMVHLLRLLGRRVWWLAGLAMQRPPRRRPSRSDAA